MPAPKTVAEYIGQSGEFQPGVPASDLTEEQFDALPEEHRTWVLANAASDQPIYKLHGRDLKAESKQVVVEMAPSENAAPTAVATAPREPSVVDAKPSEKSAPKADKPS